MDHIAAETGFGTAVSFRHYFHRFLGTSPTADRALLVIGTGSLIAAEFWRVPRFRPGHWSRACPARCAANRARPSRTGSDSMVLCTSTT
ncbi:hypothetical protein ACW2Q0_14975 [Nocardia sp. R16R-3T]